MSAANTSIWKRFRKNKLGLIALVYIAIVSVVALFAYLIIPDKVTHANQVRLSLALAEPGKSVQVLKVPIQQNDQGFWLFTGKRNNSNEVPISSYRIKGDELLVKLYPADSIGIEKSYSASDLGLEKLNEQSLASRIGIRKFHLGTDKLGRDMLSRLLLGARISLSVGIIAVLISLVFGVFMGGLAGYFGGKVDQLIMWLVNVFWSVPTLLWVIAISLALGKGLWQVYVAVGLSMWVDVARMLRGQVMSVREMQYVSAGQALGYGSTKIFLKHVLPNSFAPVIVIAASNFATAILLEAGLSFLGIGAQPPIPSWGNMIKDHYAYIIMDKAYLAYLPGLAIMSLVLAFMLIGNALRDVLDVKTEN